MSCEQNTKAKEQAYDNFVKIFTKDSEFENFMKENMFNHMEIWREKEHGIFDWEPYDRIFEELWDYDAEGCYYDIKAVAYKLAGEK